MEVGEVRDPEAVEAFRQSVDLDLEHARPQPAGLEEAVGEQGEGGKDDASEEKTHRDLEGRDHREP